MADFFDKLKQGVGKGVTTVSVKSREMLDISRLKSQIVEVQQQKREALEELGNIVHTMLAKGVLDEERLRTKNTAITALDEQIKQKESELTEIHAKAQEALGKPRPIAICACGAEIYEGAKFCGKCGKKVEATP
jgi:NADH pyrophosphatase NudC (nudix superfamily)